MKYIAALMCVIGAPAFANCPDPMLDGTVFEATGPQLLAPQDWPVSAGGVDVAPCANWVAEGVDADQISGYLPVGPTGVFELTQMGPHILTVRARASCDAVLAVRSGDGIWYFGEQRGDVVETTLWGVPDGPLKVWVGTKGQVGCDGSVQLETYDR